MRRASPVTRVAAIALVSIAATSVAELPATARAVSGRARLFVGTCYQPVDRSPEQIRKDIALMRAAGFTLVRMGDLSWDAFEPSDGIFEFAWFDDILKQMNEAGIKVILDIAGLPAPTWLHHKHLSVNVVDQKGVMPQPARRYMEDISDPAYREHARRYAEALTLHYAGNPAVIAVGYDNEIGDDGDRAGLRAAAAIPRRALGVERVHRLLEAARQPAQFSPVLAGVGGRSSTGVSPPR